MNRTHAPHQLHPSFLSAPCTGDPLAAFGRPHVIGWENYEQTELTMEPTPKTKELQPIGIPQIQSLEVLKSCRQTRLPFQGRASTMNHVVAPINHYRKYHNVP